VKHTENYNQKPNNLLKRSLQGYCRFFRGILWFLAAAALVALTGFIIVYPLWHFASEYKNGYSLAALGILFLTMAFILVRKLKTSVRGAGGFGAWMKTSFLRFVKKAVYGFLAVLVLYIAVFLFAQGYILAASGIALVYLLVLGVVLAGRRDSV
jgi:hypothetical protein